MITEIRIVIVKFRHVARLRAIKDIYRAASEDSPVSAQVRSPCRVGNVGRKYLCYIDSVGVERLGNQRYAPGKVIVYSFFRSLTGK